MRILIMMIGLVLLLTSCTQRLDTRIVDLFSDVCECDENKCECQDAYTGDLFVLDCTGIEVTSLSSIAKNCKYSCLIDGIQWCK